MTYSFGTVILAAGKGTRLKMDCPKPLAPVVGEVLMNFPISEVAKFYSSVKVDGKISVVTGYQAEIIESHVKNVFSNDLDISFALQEKQNGTGDALKSYFSKCSWAKETDYTAVLCADTPMIREEDLKILFDKLIEDSLDGVVATFIEDNPKGYGRIVKGDRGFHIVEEKDATDEIRKIKEVNSGLYIVKTSYMLKHLDVLDSNNSSGEFYLTDIFKDDQNVASLCFENSNTFIGVNTLLQLEEVNTLLRLEKNTLLREDGVRFIDSSSVYIDWGVKIGQGSIIYPNAVIEGKSVIGKNSKIGIGAVINDSTIEDGVEIKPYSSIEDAIVRVDAVVGPYARLRPNADIGPESKIGNFVEIKKAKLDRGVKVSHLSYVGDAEIGSDTNIGCGFITCNYDGANKHITKIGKGCFIGSDSQMVAPVELGDKCFVASGSTITNSMEDGAFAISRGKQLTKNGLARRFIKSKDK